MEIGGWKADIGSPKNEGTGPWGSSVLARGAHFPGSPGTKPGDQWAQYND